MTFMPGESGPAFVDTNILVYAFEKGDSDKKRVSQRLLLELMDKDLLRLSTQVLQELFVTLTRKGVRPCRPDEAIAVLDELVAWPVAVVDYPAIRAAGSLSAEAMISFWDALIVITAARCGASVVYTEDLNAGQEIAGVHFALSSVCIRLHLWP